MTARTALQFSTCDFCDTYKSNEAEHFRVLPPVFKDYGRHLKFAGQVMTVKCYEDNSLVKKAVESAGAGRVLVVDGAGSLRRALLGGNLAAAAERNGWAGIVINGCVRDAAELAVTALGIRALALHPMPTLRADQGQQGVAVFIQGVCVRPGDWLYADADGMVVCAEALHVS
ncbi:ribonuclease [Limnohabitans sp. T6-5]|uniref:ribonuclease E activity regulator RraA n=1 Tax=Limnohabitans sp. T6-5 TaxID=1100724 RepID=UPI000D3B595D|nr:ribonuclease E activity regulator RraA [Limnohabitans sp. T6-5]PUE08537.1 ribonuclease [Limnohabitans sp. T6-5]